jgi:inosose dehydratase
LKLSYQTNAWDGVVGHPVGVTSVKDLFYLATGSTEHALREIAAAGYQGVEIFDGNLVEYEGREDELGRLLEENGLQLVGTYSGGNFIFPEILEEELWRVEKAATVAAGLGAEHLVVGGGAQRFDGTRDEDYDRLGDALDRVVAIAEAHGLAASFHPHLTTIVETPEQIERVLERSRINFCPDTAHNAAGGGDPVELIRRWSDRIVCVHLKDFRRDPFGFLPLGRGELDFPGMLAALDEAGYDGWITVEADGYEGDAREAAEESRRYLEQLRSNA